MTASSPDLIGALLAKLTAGNMQSTGELQKLMDEIPDKERGEISKLVARYGSQTDLAALCQQNINDEFPIDVLTADTILKTDWPEPVWAIPGILPVGLCILAGAPKVGKSWFALQIAQAIASGGMVFGKRIEKGRILYLALEDPPRRLQDRMKKQGWPLGLDAEFMTLGNFADKIGDLRNGGGIKLANQIERRGYRMVAIDTLSRSIQGDQNDVSDMTSWLTPLQETAHDKNTSILLNDHHRKTGGFNQDVIADILGSTAKGAMADTILGLYRERGKPGARLTITGREVEEQTLEIKMDFLTGCWQLDTDAQGLTPQKSGLLDILADLGPSKITEIAEAADRNPGNIYKQLADLEGKGLVIRNKKLWRCVEK